MLESCPINYERIDANRFRIASLIIFMIVLWHLYSESWIIVMLLAVDLMVRLYVNKQYSPILQMARWFQHLLRIESRIEDAAPKRLAAYFALLFMLLLGISSYMHYNLFHLLIAGVFLICSALEIGFGYCLGCKIYYVLQRYHILIRE